VARVISLKSQPATWNMATLSWRRPESIWPRRGGGGDGLRIVRAFALPDYDVHMSEAGAHAAVSNELRDPQTRNLQKDLEYGLGEPAK